MSHPMCVCCQCQLCIRGRAVGTLLCGEIASCCSHGDYQYTMKELFALEYHYLARKTKTYVMVIITEGGYDYVYICWRMSYRS